MVFNRNEAGISYHGKYPKSVTFLNVQGSELFLTIVFNKFEKTI